MKSIKGLEGTRWFIWTIVIMVAALGSLAAYISYSTEKDSIDLVSNAPLSQKIEAIAPAPSSSQTNKAPSPIKYK